MLIIDDIIVGQMNADAQVDAARISAESAERVARLNARSAVYAADQERIARQQGQAMEMAAMQESIRQQREAARLQRDQAEKLGAREELRFAVGEATKDTYEKVTNAFTSWAQSNNIAEEQMLRSQFGLNEDHRFDAPIQEPNMYDMMNVDLLTGEEVDNSNPYQMSDDTREEDQQINRLYPDQFEPAADLRDPFFSDLIGDLENRSNNTDFSSDVPPRPEDRTRREGE